MLVEVQEVVALQQLVGEFRERQSITSCTVQTLLHAVLGHHVVDGNMLTYFTGKIKERKVFHPVIVVDHLCSIFVLRLKIKELGHLLLDTLLVVTQRLFVQQIALLRLTAGVANHTCGTAYEDDGLVTTTLQMAQHHDTAKMTDVQRVCCGVSTQIGSNQFFLEQLFRARHHLCQHAAPFQFFYKILFHILLFTFFNYQLS